MKPMNRMMRLLFDPMILAVSAATLKLYNVSITDQSPLISYSPATIGDGTTSWNISYTGSPWTSFQTGQYNEGVGQSYHWTEAALAYASFSFTGSAVYAMGNSTSGVAYFVVDGVDGTAMGNTTGILAAAEGLEMGLHKVQFSWKGGLGRVNLTGFTFTVGIGSLG